MNMVSEGRKAVPWPITNPCVIGLPVGETNAPDGNIPEVKLKTKYSAKETPQLLDDAGGTVTGTMTL
ncbi:hypothetical protein, partial [Acidithiobacillus sp.]|uniref:hypothetical protein n=1 Tax=Acidithiobacillus sp. TaxID=1872118 RepID=UPI0025BD8E2A